MATKKKVVIVGAGYSGCSCAKTLDKFAAKDIELTLVSKRDGFFLNKYSAIRAAVAHGTWTDRALIPLSSLLKYGKVVINSVASIDAAGQKVVMDNGDTLRYDVLVIATGSRNFSPAEAPLSITTKDDTQKYYAEQSKMLKETKSVVIVGSGPVAIELAGELKHFGQKDIKVSLVTRSAHVLQGKTPPTKDNIDSVSAMLKSEKVDVYLQDEIASIPFPTDLSVASAMVRTLDGVKLRSGKEIKCDLLVYTVGAILNTQFLPSEWLDAKSKEVIVDEKTLLVKGTNNIFCVGDAAKINFTKLGYFATEDGKIVGKNVMDVVRGKAPSKSISRPSLMLILPFGPHKGRVLLPFTTLGGWLASLVKGKGLFAKLQWSLIAPDKKPPHASA